MNDYILITINKNMYMVLYDFHKTLKILLNHIYLNLVFILFYNKKYILVNVTDVSSSLTV